jgi:two-component system, OmpR family, response regulator
MTNVLLIDDDVQFVAHLKEYLEREGFSIATAHNSESGIVQALSGRYTIAVLDALLPKLNGIEVLKRIRMQSAMPIVMLMANGDDADRIVGLELGADDCVAVPCAPREIAARLRAILRRTQTNGQMASSANASFVVGSLVVWPQQRRAEWLGKTLRLTSTEFSLLELLARNAGSLVGKNDLSQLGLGRPLSRFDRSIDVHLSSIRQKLGTLPDGRSIIQTVFRKGYQFIKE